jgi:hypothetical protein
MFRIRRQSADVKATEYFARLALERMPSDCLTIGCGLVDLVARYCGKNTTLEHTDILLT